MEIDWRLENHALGRRLWPVGMALALLLLITGCATPQRAQPERAFDFKRDTFSYANELVWEYHFDPVTGKRTTTKREPKPDYTLHCFVVARSAKQFFYNAKFAPEQPKVDDATYRKLADEVMRPSPRAELPIENRVVIPGYADLKSFSTDHEALLKAECGRAWESYLQRGHWRMLLPFSRSHQAKGVVQLVENLKAKRPTVVHVVRFPSLAINHAILLYDVVESEKEIGFSVYDPNEPQKPTTLTYDRATRTFTLPTNLYFAGGRVDVYEIYRSAMY